MKLLILGCGYVGVRLKSYLRAEGHEVFGLRRSETTAPDMLSGDVTSPASLSALPSDFDTIVYAVSPHERSDEAYRKAYPVGVENTLRRFPSARVLFVSSTAVYGSEDGLEIDDSSTATATNFSSIRLREAEDLVRGAPKKHLILRCSGIYGPGRTRLLSRLLYEELPTNAGEVWTNRIHRDDVAKILVWSLRHEEVSGTYIASDREPAQLAELQAFIRTLPDARRKLRAPDSGGAPLHRHNRRIIPTRLIQAGYDPIFPSYREGYCDIIAQLPAE